VGGEEGKEEGREGKGRGGEGRGGRGRRGGLDPGPNFETVVAPLAHAMCIIRFSVVSSLYKV
jgi:hypothetical protein